MPSTPVASAATANLTRSARSPSGRAVMLTCISGRSRLVATRVTKPVDATQTRRPASPNAPPAHAGPAGPAVVSPRFPESREMVPGSFAWLLSGSLWREDLFVRSTLGRVCGSALSVGV